MNEERVIYLINTNADIKKQERHKKAMQQMIYKARIKGQKEKLYNSLFTLVIALIALLLTVSKAMYM